MQFRTTGLLLLGAMALPASGTAQTTPIPPAINANSDRCNQTADPSRTCRSISKA